MQVSNFFTESAQQTFNESLNDTSKADTWNTFQDLVSAPISLLCIRKYVQSVFYAYNYAYDLFWSTSAFCSVVYISSSSLTAVVCTLTKTTDISIPIILCLNHAANPMLTLVYAILSE